MITREEVARLMARPEGPAPLLSLFVDLGPGPGSPRTHEVFLAGQRRGARELAAGHPPLQAADVESFVDRAAAWLRENQQPASAGAACFGDAEGGWFEAYQVPLALPNRLLVARLPAVAPLLNALQGHRLHAVVLADRVRLRLLLVWLGTVLREEEERRELYPAHDVHAGGSAERGLQQHKLDEQRQTFAAFAAHTGRFVRETGAESVVLLGTDENVARLRRALPREVHERLTAVDGAPVDAPAAEVLERLAAVLDDGADHEGDELVLRLRERAATGWHATTGVQRTLSALQKGAVEAAVLPGGGDTLGARCTRCGFLFSSTPEACPFDGAPVERGVPVVEEAIRLAAAQGARIRLLPPRDAEEFAGAGALLRF